MEHRLTFCIVHMDNSHMAHPRHGDRYDFSNGEIYKSIQGPSSVGYKTDTFPEKRVKIPTAGTAENKIQYSGWESSF